MTTILLINNQRTGEGCFHEYNGRLYYYCTKFYKGNTDITFSDIARYDVTNETDYSEYEVVISGQEAKINVMDCSICDNKLFYLRKNSLMDCQIRYYNLNSINITGDSQLVKDGGYYPLVNDAVIKLSIGRILLATAHKDFAKYLDSWKIIIIKSDDNGKTWSYSSPINAPFWIKSGYQEPVIIEMYDGRLLMFIRTGTGWLYYSISYNQGDRWSIPKRYIPSPLSIPTIKKYKDKYYMLGNQRFAKFQGAKLGNIRTPLYLTIFNKGFQVIENHCNESSIFGFYCYPSIYFFNDYLYMAYYTGKEPFNHTIVYRVSINDL